LRTHLSDRFLKRKHLLLADIVSDYARKRSK
jgi:hypothetical protein